MDEMSEEIIHYWFSDRIKSQWFSSTPELDREILDKYEALWDKAVQGELDEWSKSPTGSLALVLLLDQFPLNMFRNQAKSFSAEKKALEISRNAINLKLDQKIERAKIAFLYMPFMHSEDMDDQDISVKLYREKGLVNNIKFAEHHRDIVRKYGRFPHRNKILSRESTEEELIYLASDAAFMG